MNRVLYKILSTSLNLFLSTVIFLILAREIGPVSFGNLSYVTATYTFLLDFFTKACFINQPTQPWSKVEYCLPPNIDECLKTIFFRP